MANTLNWFEIPTTDLIRATSFYERVLGISLKREDFGGTPMSIFAARDPDMAGAGGKGAPRKPSSDGALVYLNVNGNLDTVVGRIAGAGGELLVPKTDIGEPGFIALFRDTEGNVVDLTWTGRRGRTLAEAYFGVPLDRQYVADLFLARKHHDAFLMPAAFMD